MQTRTQRQRKALYAGIADVPVPDADQVVDRFTYGYARRPHAAATYLLYDMHRILTRPMHRPLPGMPTAA